MAIEAHPLHPRFSIRGDVPGLPLTFVGTGEMAQRFTESYTTEITALNRAAKGGGPAGQTPHPPDMNFDRGSFQPLTFNIELFSGCLVNLVQQDSGRQLHNIAEILFRICMPRPSGESFVGPPLVVVQYGSFWRAKGLFQKATYISQGAYDAEGFPTLQTIQMEFSRHFGGGVGPGGIYKNAEIEDLRRATATGFKFLE